MPQLSPETRDYLIRVFQGKEEEKPCEDCGGAHKRACPRVKRYLAIANDQGLVVHQEREFWPPGTWEQDVIFPDQLFEEDDDARPGD